MPWGRGQRSSVNAHSSKDSTRCRGSMCNHSMQNLDKDPRHDRKACQQTLLNLRVCLLAVRSRRDSDTVGSDWVSLFIAKDLRSYREVFQDFTSSDTSTSDSVGLLEHGITCTQRVDLEIGIVHALHLVVHALGQVPWLTNIISWISFSSVMVLPGKKSSVSLSPLSLSFISLPNLNEPRRQHAIEGLAT